MTFCSLLLSHLSGRIYIVVDGAHNIKLSMKCSLLSHTPLSFQKIVEVIGRCERGGFPCFQLVFQYILRLDEAWPSGDPGSHEESEFDGLQGDKFLWLNELDPVALGRPQK